MDIMAFMGQKGVKQINIDTHNAQGYNVQTTHKGVNKMIKSKNMRIQQWDAIKAYQFDNRIDNATEAINKLIAIGLKEGEAVGVEEDAMATLGDDETYDEYTTRMKGLRDGN